MEFYLFRTHFKAGTNGMLFHKQHFICFCIEAPWRCNQSDTSCIPDGVYEMRPSYSLQFGHQVRLLNVPGRCGILLRADASNKCVDAKGALIVVQQLCGIGIGLGSKEAMHKVLMRMEAARSVGQTFFLTVVSEHTGR